MHASYVMGQTTHKEVIAIKSDGVYSILRRHNIDPTKYYKQFIALNKKNISPDNGLIIGKTYILPIVKKEKIHIETKPIAVTDSIIIKPADSMPLVEKINDPIFGKEHSSITIEDKKLNGAIYYLISGHGGPDPGATEIYNGSLISEDEYAYDVTLRLAKLLLARSATVYIIIKDPNDGIRNKRILEIDYDEVSYPNKQIPKSQKLRLRQRTQAVNDLYIKHKGSYQRLIVTHVDSRSKGKNIDVFFYHHEKSKKGKRLAENIHSSFKQKYAKHQPNRQYFGTVSSRKLYLVKNTLPAMVYIELGNIKSYKDQKRLLNYLNREALAKWIFEGLVSDFDERK
ncbi:N-acetylmuramoyl-L-alanine amidase [Flavivirga jejuensis]